ncbi:MAG: 16S rRNA processing protein RimM [Bacilli bacterium]|nr:16S rRNA processing protein RimM [Bacilli bacterium]
MKYVYVGKIVNTHALKGEVRILSNFEYKSRVFKPGVKLYMGQFKTEEVIETYRPHKQYDMVKFININTIQDVLKYKGDAVYVNEEVLDLSEDEILEEELIKMEIYVSDKLIGKIDEFRNDNGNKMLKVKDKYIPYNKDFIAKIDKANKRIYMHDIEVFL